MAVAEGIALFVAHSFEELVNPNGSINGEALAVKGGEISRARTRLDDLPEALNTHLGECSRVDGVADWDAKTYPWQGTIIIDLWDESHSSE